MDFLCHQLHCLAHRHAAFCARGAGQGQYVRHLCRPDQFRVLPGAGSGVCAIFSRASRTVHPQSAFHLLHCRSAFVQRAVLASPACLLARSQRRGGGRGGFFRFSVPLPVQLLPGCFPLSFALLPHGAKREALYHSRRFTGIHHKNRLSGRGLWRRDRQGRPFVPDRADGRFHPRVCPDSAQPLRRPLCFTNGQARGAGALQICPAPAAHLHPGVVQLLHHPRCA